MLFIIDISTVNNDHGASDSCPAVFKSLFHALLNA